MLIYNSRDVFPDHVQQRRLSRHKVRAGIEDLFEVKSHKHTVGTVDQDPDLSQATASVSISHRSIASARDSRKEPGGEESERGECKVKAYQSRDESVSHVVVDRGIKGTYGKGHEHGQKIEGMGNGHEHWHLMSDQSSLRGNDAVSPSETKDNTTTARRIARNPDVVLDTQDSIPDVGLNAHERRVDDVLIPDFPFC